MNYAQPITIAVAGLLILLPTLKNLKKIKDKESDGELSDILPIGLYDLGIALITSSIFRIEDAHIFLYSISDNSERLSLIKYFSESTTDLILIGAGFVCIILSVIFYILFESKFNFGVIKLLNIQTNGDNTLQNFDKKDYKLNLYETEILNLQDLWSNILSKGPLHQDFKENIQKIIDKVRQSMLAFKSSSRGSKRAFTGIAPIPFLIYAGSVIPKLEFSEFLEIQNRSGNKLIPLNKKENVEYPLLQISGDLDRNNKDDELVIAVSTTCKILDSQLRQFSNRGIDIRFISLTNPSHQALVSVEQVNSYANIIIDQIIAIKQIKPHIKTVHLICASKPSLVFRIGQLIDNNTQLPYIISYQQLQGENVEYPWGLYINHPQKQGQAVLWNEL